MLQIDHQLNKLKGKNFHLKIRKHYIKFTKSSKMLTSMLHEKKVLLNLKFRYFCVIINQIHLWELNFR